MTRLFILFIFFIVLKTSNAYACQINLSKKILIPKKGLVTGLTFSQECSQIQIDDAMLELSSFQGRIRNEYISNNLSSKKIAIQNPKDVSEFIQIFAMTSEQVKIKKITDIKLENSSFIKMLEIDDQIALDCSHCLKNGKNIATIVVKKKTGEELRIPLSVYLDEPLNAYQILSNIPAFTQGIDKKFLKEVSFEINPHVTYFTDLSKLHFYKTNKELRPGDLLKKSDLSPVNLVRAGLRTEINLENKFVKIKIFGLSKSNGGFGETVEVFQKEKNKIYIGKVIDENKVMVKL